MIPILMGIGYGIYIGFMLFFTFFQFLSSKEVKKKLISSSMSILLLALILLTMHVKEILGNSYTMMTFMIILSVGYYFSTVLDGKEIKQTLSNE